MIPDDSWLVAAGHSQTSAIKGMYDPKSVKVPQLRLGRGSISCTSSSGWSASYSMFPARYDFFEATATPYTNSKFTGKTIEEQENFK
jgi:hypothetical protein